MNLIRNFLKDQDGAITVDFVVLTAAIVTLGLVVGTVISSGAEGLNNKTVDQLENMDPDS